jgi:hypothetical protein
VSGRDLKLVFLVAYGFLAEGTTPTGQYFYSIWHMNPFLYHEYRPTSDPSSSTSLNCKIGVKAPSNEEMMLDNPETTQATVTW